MGPALTVRPTGVRPFTGVEVQQDVGKSIWDRTKSFIQEGCSPNQSVRWAGFYCIFIEPLCNSIYIIASDGAFVLVH